MKNDPFCDICEGAEICDIEHVFSKCERTRVLWSWVRGKIVKWLGVGGLSDWELLNLRFPNVDRAKEVLWLVGTYIEGIYDRVFVNEKHKIDGAEFFGWLQFKFRMANYGARQVVENILELDDMNS